jgi:hypothetical protein
MGRVRVDYEAVGMSDSIFVWSVLLGSRAGTRSKTVFSHVKSNSNSKWSTKSFFPASLPLCNSEDKYNTGLSLET